MFQIFGMQGPYVLILFLVAIGAIAAIWARLVRNTPVSSVHPGKRADEHGHHSCKFDADEVRRTERMIRPRIDTKNIAGPDPRVAAILAAVDVKDVEKAVKELSGELPINGTKITSRSTHYKDIAVARDYCVNFYKSLGFGDASKLPGSSVTAMPFKRDGKTHYNVIAILKLKNGCEVRFCHFTGEEQGLWGSYVYSDVVAKEKVDVIGMIQMDMIGFAPEGSNRVDVHDDKDRNGSHWLVEVLTKAAARYALNLTVADTHNHAVQDRSDHAGFLDHGMKAVLVSEWFSDEGFNPKYHSLGDRINIMNLPWMTNIIRMVLAGAIEMTEGQTGKVLVIGSHLDSTAGRPWVSESQAPGADDDASGTVGVLEIARAMSAMTKS